MRQDDEEREAANMSDVMLLTVSEQLGSRR